MKKLWIPCVCLILLFALASCKNPATPAVSNSAPAGGTPQTTAGGATPVPTQAGYSIKTEYYEKTDESFELTASYPQLEGAGYDAVNTLIEDSALSTINASLGYEDDGSFTTVETTGTVAFSDPGFISITFSEYYNNSLAAHPSSAFRTINIDLKSGTVVAGDSLINANGDLYKAIYKAAGTQLSADFMDQLTLDDFETGYDANAIYFTPDRVGFSIWVFHYLGDHVEITLPYAEAAPFMTSSAILDRFK